MKVRVLKAKANNPGPPEYQVRVSWITVEGDPPVETIHYQILEDMTQAQFLLFAASKDKEVDVDFSGAVVNSVEV